MKRILLVANVAKEHILKFHIPTIKAFRNHGWVVDGQCNVGSDYDRTVQERLPTDGKAWKRHDQA